jgi:hypothetical protein
VGLKRTDEFRQDAVRIALTIGLTADNHTDRRSQYYSHDYQKILRQNGFTVSMSGKGNCNEFKDGLRSRWDDQGDHLKSQNAAVETFFKTPLGIMLRITLSGKDQGWTDLAASVGDKAESWDGNLRIDQWLLQSASEALSLRLEKSGRLRT